MRLLKGFLAGFLLLLFTGTAFGATQGVTSYNLSITEIEGLQHSFSANVYKMVNGVIANTYNVSSSISPIYTSSIGAQYGTQFPNNSSLVGTANNVYNSTNTQKLIENAGGIIQQYSITNVGVNTVYSANVYNPATNSYQNKWAVNTVLWTPNVENLAALDFNNALSHSSGWIVTTPNPYVAEVTYYTHNVGAGIQALPNYSSTIAPVLNKYLGDLLVQIYQLTPNGLGNVVATPLNVQIPVQTAYNAGFEVNEVNTTTAFSEEVLVTNLIKYINSQYLAPYDPQYVIANYVDNWDIKTDTNNTAEGCPDGYTLDGVTYTCPTGGFYDASIKLCSAKATTSYSCPGSGVYNSSTGQCNAQTTTVTTPSGIAFSMQYVSRQINGSCQVNYTYGNGWSVAIEGSHSGNAIVSGLCFDGNGNAQACWIDAGAIVTGSTSSIATGTADLVDQCPYSPDFALNWGYISAGVHDDSSPYTNWVNLYTMGQYSQVVIAAGGGMWTNGFNYNQGWFQVATGVGNGAWVQVLVPHAESCSGTYYNGINFYLGGITAIENTYQVPEPFQSIPTNYGDSYVMQKIASQTINPTALNSSNLGSAKEYSVSVNGINTQNADFDNIIIDPFNNTLCDYTISSGTDSLGYGACSFDTSLIASTPSPVVNNMTNTGAGCAPGLTYQNGYCVRPAETFWSYASSSGGCGNCNCDSSGNGTISCSYELYNPYAFQACPPPFNYSNGYCYAPAGGSSSSLNGLIPLQFYNGFITGWGNFNPVNNVYTSAPPQTTQGGYSESCSCSIGG